MNETPEQRRRRMRWLTLGELLAVVAVAISALGLWKTWNSGDQPATVVEQRQPIALTLRGKAGDDGRNLEITPVEPGHALQSLTITIKGSPPIEVGSDGQLGADEVEAALKDLDHDRKGAGKVPVRIAVRYVEAGADRRGGGTYMLSYRWEGGGLFGGRSLRLVGMARA